jgi:hypothetical protein
MRYSQEKRDTIYLLRAVMVVLVMMEMMVHGDYLTVVSSGTTNLLVWVTENGTVTNVGDTPYIYNPQYISAAYCASDQMYYALYDSKNLFHYSITDQTNDSVLLQVPQGSELVAMCVSQQFGTIFAIQVTGLSASLVEITLPSGDITPAAAPFPITTNTAIQQCIVDDAFSRVVWTYHTLNSSQQVTCSIASTDLLPQMDGSTSPLYNDSILQIWLFFNWNSETFYATTITEQEPQISMLAIAVDGVKKTILIPKVDTKKSKK